MFDLPNLHQIQPFTPYTNLFMYTLLWNIGLFGMLVFVLFWVFFCLKINILHKRKQIQQSRQSLLTYQANNRQSQQTQNRESAVAITDSHQSIAEEKNKKSITFFDFINFLTSFAFYLTLISIAGVYLGFYIFGMIGRGTGHDILAVVILISIVVLPTIIWKKQTKTRISSTLKKQVIFTIAMLILWTATSIIMVIMLKGVCICAFNTKYGTNVNKDFQFSSQFSRFLQIDKVCPDGKVCHMYATLAENASDSVFINVHTGTNIQNITILLQSVAQTQDSEIQLLNLTNSKPYRMTDIQYIAKRNIFSLYFSGLKPDTLYSVIAKQTTSEVVLYRTNYRTLPGQNANELRMAVGGDVGIDQSASTLTSYLQEFQPHVLIIGGDNAYDDGMRTCFYSWDNVYDIFDELNGKLNRMVPVIFSIGNHDVGFDALAGIKIDFNDTDNLPYYYLYNPQHKLENSTEAPEPKNRRGYHYHILGPTVHVHLDSGYTNSFQSQKQFIEKINKDFPNLYKFANYHNPIYPSCTDNTQGSNDRQVIQEGLKHWTPSFDSGKFVAAFEHHTHHRKFTKKIIGNQVSTNKTVGTRYIGDGSWGVPEDPCNPGHITPYPNNFQYYETEHPNHVWKVKLFKTTNISRSYSIEYKAIDLNNTVVFAQTDSL